MLSDPTIAVPRRLGADVRLPAFGPGQAAACFLLAVGLVVMRGLRDLPEVLGGALINPDSTMRLLRLQEWLAQGHPVHAVPRDVGGAGMVLPWSHFLELLLLLLAAPLVPVLGWDAAVRVVFVAAGPLGAGLLGVALAWAIAPVTRPDLRWFAAIAAALAVPVSGYALPGLVHHHIPVAVAVVLTLGWAARGPAMGAAAGWRMGLAAGAGLLLTPESMPFTLMGFGLLGLMWLAGGRQAAPLAARAARAAGVAYLAVVALGLVLDPPATGYGAVEIDRVSVVYLCLAAACAVVGCGLTVLGRVAGCVLAVAAVALWIAAFPMLLRGPAGVLPPEQAALFFKDIAEMSPVRGLGQAVILLAPGALGVVGLSWLAWRRRSLGWAYAAVCGMAVLVLSAGHVRFSTYAAILGAGMLPVLLGAVSAGLAGGARAAGRLAVLGGFLLLPPAGVLLMPAQAAEEAGAATCSVRASAPGLWFLAGQVLMADPNETPELLRYSGVLTVGSLYHRSAGAFLDLRAAWRAVPGEVVPEAVRATRATHMLVCAGGRRGSLVRDLPAVTLRDRLVAGTPPGWAVRVAALPGGHVLYRIAD